MTLPCKFVVINRLFEQQLTRIRFFCQPAFGAVWDIRSGVASFFVPRKSSTFGLSTVLAGVFFFVLLAAFSSGAQTAQPSEYQVKAAFLFNFAKFVDWPATAFPAPASPVIIGVLGKNVFGDSLEQTLHNKSINNRPVELKIFQTVAEATNCHVLFISTSEKGHLAKTLAALQGTSILTVSEMDEFISAGGMINFVIEDSKIHFEINDSAAEKAGLKISSKLLSLSIHHQ